jgi:hypothetical protein
MVGGAVVAGDDEEEEVGCVAVGAGGGKVTVWITVVVAFVDVIESRFWDEAWCGCCWWWIGGIAAVVVGRWLPGKIACGSNLARMDGEGGGISR